MDTDLFDVYSDCSSELSETRSELEARIYSIIHHNDFSGTSEFPYIDAKYGVEINSNDEVVVFLKDSNVIVEDSTETVRDSSIKLHDVYNNSVIPTIVLDDSCIENSNHCINLNDNEFAETSLKKKKKKKKKKKNLNNGTIEDYMNIVKNTNALAEYKKKSGLNKMNSVSNNVDNVALNVSFNYERSMPMTPNEILKQYTIGKPAESSLWYRCPKTWTPDMIKYYTKIQKSKRNFDCREEMRKIREKYGSNPIDWTLNPLDMYKRRSSTPKIRCNICRQFGHTGNYCKVKFKPEICIMCGMEGHNFHCCSNQLCLSCGTWQKQFTNNCKKCISMSRVKCNICNTVGHESNFCTENWRQFHNTTSTMPIPENNEFTQSTSKSNFEAGKSTKRKSETLTSSTSDGKEKSKKSPKLDDSDKTKKAKKSHRTRSKRKHPKSNNQNNITVSDNESINIDFNIQDVTLKRTLSKKKFFKKKKLNINS